MKNKIVVDSNILFSAMLNLNSHIGQILLSGKAYYNFYAPQYVRTELFRHKSKIEKITGFTNNEFHEVYGLIVKNVTLLNDSILPIKFLKKGIEYCKEIDEDDSIFVGFSEYLKAKLWTGDMALTRGLHKKGFNRSITTKELFADFLDKNN